MDPIPLILLAGMGADERVFSPQREAFPQLTVQRWIPPQPNESLPAYAARFARQIDPGGPCFVGGASFGGFVAIEMARHLQARGVFLIGSCRSPCELPLRIRMLRKIRSAASWMPFEPVCELAGVGAIVCARLPVSRTRSLLRQLADADARFLRWACRAVLEWEQPSPPLDVPVHHIHGRRDHVLPVGRTRADVIVEGAGHVLSLSHARDVNAFLRERMEHRSLFP